MTENRSTGRKRRGEVITDDITEDTQVPNMHAEENGRVNTHTVA